MKYRYQHPNNPAITGTCTQPEMEAMREQPHYKGYTFEPIEEPAIVAVEPPPPKAKTAVGEK